MQIPLTGGYVATVDPEDFDRLMSMGAWQCNPRKYTTYARKSVYVSGRIITLRMHSVITGWSYVDHVNGNGLDNRRCNLRQATHTQNMRNKRTYSNNTSGFKGVGWHVKSSSWEARIWRNRKATYLGRYATPEDAARAYDLAALALFGEFARPNFPQEISK